MKRAVIWVLLAVGPFAAWAEERARGPVTNLPLPRFVSAKAQEVNVRRGPGLTHRIDWVFRRRDMPLEITAEFGNWRRVRDKDGAGGWVHYSLLSGVRTVIVEQDLLALRMKPDCAAGGMRAGDVPDQRGRVPRLGGQGRVMGRGGGRDPRVMRHGGQDRRDGRP